MESTATTGNGSAAWPRLLPLVRVGPLPPRRGLPRPGAPAARNHGTFRLYRVDEEDRPDLLERFDVTSVPTLLVLQDKHVQARLERPRGCREIERFLGPWLN